MTAISAAKTLIASAAIAAAFAFTLPAAPARAGVDVDIGIGVGGYYPVYPGHHGYGRYDGDVYDNDGYDGGYQGGGYVYDNGYGYDDGYGYPRHRGISCRKGLRILDRAGFDDVRAVDCEGPNFRYIAWKHGRKYVVKVNASGGITSVRRVY